MEGMSPVLGQSPDIVVVGGVNSKEGRRILVGGGGIRPGGEKDAQVSSLGWGTGRTVSLSLGSRNLGQSAESETATGKGSGGAAPRGGVKKSP